MKYYKKPRHKNIIFLQGDGKWGARLYPAKGATVASAGCGLCSVTHASLERDMYADSTPLTWLEFMKKYAIVGNGTAWAGIPAGLKHIGMKDVKEFNGDINGGSMKPFFDELKKGKRIAIVLFQNPLRGSGKTAVAGDGTIWTTGGHYVFFGGVRVNDGKMEFFCKDSSFRKNNGWKGYQKSMKGWIRVAWTARVPAEDINLPDKGYFEKGDSSPEIKKIQKFLKSQGLYRGLCRGNLKRWTRKAILKFQKKYNLKQDGKFGAECLRKYEEIA